jgi:hypothetical protein
MLRVCYLADPLRLIEFPARPQPSMKHQVCLEDSAPISILSAKFSILLPMVTMQIMVSEPFAILDNVFSTILYPLISSFLATHMQDLKWLE